METNGTVALRITQAARRVGCHPDTLRRLEKQGLVKPRRDWTGARRYSLRDIERLKRLIFPPSVVNRSGVEGPGHSEQSHTMRARCGAEERP